METKNTVKRDSKNGDNNFEKKLFLLFVGFSIFQFLFHIFCLITTKDPKVLIPTVIAFSHDLFLLMIYYFLSLLIIKFSPISIRNIIKKISVAGFITIAGLLAFYPKMLREFLIFPVNIFESDMSVAKTTAIEYLGISSFIPVLITIILGLYLAYFFKKELKISLKCKSIIFIIIFLVSVFFLQKSSPNPIIYGLQNEFESLIKGENRVVPSLSISNKENHNLINPLIYPEENISKYKHVLYIVLETVDTERFKKDFITINDGFYEENKNHAQLYSNYYTANLDSYTSLITMLNGITVPYRSYADDSLYDKVNQELNLVDYFNKQKFNTLFLSTFEYHPFIPFKTFWKNIYVREDLKNIDKYQTIGSSRMEKATEDKVAIDEIIEYMKNNQKSFILHELAYGHSPEWRATIGEEQLNYYDQYLRELSDKLKANNLFDNTLFVIVADHGERTDSSKKENYHVPLLIVGETLSSKDDDSFFSHKNLPEILFYSLGVKEEKPISNQDLQVIGSSEKWVYGLINNKNEYLFINNNKGIIMSQSGLNNVNNIQEDFQKYLDEFNLKYGK
jgi:hypothetical protein